MEQAEKEKVLLDQEIQPLFSMDDETAKIVDTLAAKDGITPREEIAKIIRDKLREETIIQKEANIITLEMVNQTIFSIEDPSELKKDMATKLLIAKIDLDIEKTGKFDANKAYDYVQDLF